jgi:glycosyltransferase involved in cell wall biosynthesis
MGNPFFSICIPTYKQPQLLNKLLSSINVQIFRDFEVIISDDSEDDSVVKIINKDWTFDIKYFHNEKPLGAPKNWNNAIEKGSGKWIKIMHHDDWFANNEALAIIKNEIEKKPDISFFFCSTIIHSTLTNKEEIYKPRLDYLDSIQERPIYLFPINVIGGPSATIVKNELKILYDNNIIWLSDIEYYTRIILKNKVHLLNIPLIVTSYDTETQLTKALRHNKQVEIYEFFYCYNKLHPFINRINKAIFIDILFDFIDKHNVKKIKEISESGATNKFNLYIYLYIRLDFKIIKKIIRKLNYLSINK